MNIKLSEGLQKAISEENKDGIIQYREELFDWAVLGLCDRQKMLELVDLCERFEIASHQFEGWDRSKEEIFGFLVTTYLDDLDREDLEWIIANIGQILADPKYKDAIPLVKQHFQAILAPHDFLASNTRWKGYLNFSDVDFQDLDFSYRDFSGSQLSLSVFTRLNLSWASFENARLCSVEFDNSNLKYANFCGARLSTSTFVDSDFQDSTFERANLSFCRFPRSNLQGVCFEKARIAEATFKKARLDFSSILNVEDLALWKQSVKFKGVKWCDKKISTEAIECLLKRDDFFVFSDIVFTLKRHMLIEVNEDTLKRLISRALRQLRESLAGKNIYKICRWWNDINIPDNLFLCGNDNFYNVTELFVEALCKSGQSEDGDDEDKLQIKALSEYLLEFISKRCHSAKIPFFDTDILTKWKALLDKLRRFNYKTFGCESSQPELG
ncbi:MAG: pentapeptide repeat-containing protein [Gammaproteobacteria bacterium]|nr:pentapeptide repeat-containing protein [Gammaproteobacteria bacterium]